MSDASSSQPGTILVVGASRGLGYGMACELARRGWHVIGTIRAGSRTKLDDLAQSYPESVEVETADINQPDEIAALRRRLSGRTIDILFVNAGTTTQDPNALVDAVSAEEFTRVMLTNALAPMRVIEALADLVPPDGLIGVMSSGQGSIGNNTVGGREVYRASKAALNMLMRSFAARASEKARAMLVMAPGWIRTDLGGPDAPFTLEESVPLLADLLVAKRARPGLEYLDRFGKTVPW